MCDIDIIDIHAIISPSALFDDNFASCVENSYM
jgi:hypothetical protein